MSLFRRSSAEPGDRWIVFGLGNPGERYERTRHNMGAMVVRELLDRTRSSLKRHRSGALTAEVDVGGERAVLARSTGFMNESGRPLGQLARFYKTPPGRVIVVQDEIDIPFGDVRLKFGGGTAGHNGLRSIADHLHTNDFVRVRVGVGRPRGSREAAGHVLAPFSSAERNELPALIERAADAVERVLEAGVEKAMNDVNARP